MSILEHIKVKELEISDLRKNIEDLKIVKEGNKENLMRLRNAHFTNVDLD